MQPSISVALCTYNGAEFLDEQLHSIAAQTWLPDELVIFDDGSSDDSVARADQFAATAPFRVRIHRNPRNLGCTGNFGACIAACTGDIIALSDQDDVWLPHKLERLASALGAEPGAAFAFSDALVVDPNLQPLPYGLWQAMRFTPADLRLFQQRRGFEILLKQFAVTGATLAFRAHYRDILLPIPRSWFHDAWIALILSGIAYGIPIEEPLIKYRQHSAQQLGTRTYQRLRIAERLRKIYRRYFTPGPGQKEKFRGVVEAHLAAMRRFQEKAAGAEQAVKSLQEKVRHFERRIRIEDHGLQRWPLIFGEVWAGNYSKYSAGWRHLAHDVFRAVN
ncbi:MAG: glycosyltransferase family 2 protein [Deltaproteobacteria bacterium]